MNEMQNPAPKKKGGCGKGCAIGCLTVLLLLAAGGYVAYRNFAVILQRVTAEYTATAPAALPAVQISDAEAAALRQRVETFTKALKDGTAAPELTLTSRDINALIQKHPSWSELSGKAYVTLEGDRIRAEASLPLETFGGPFKGRWLNGSGTFRVETAAGRLLVFMDALSVRGKPIPDSFMAGIRGKNLAEEAAKNPETSALLQKLDSVSVQDGKLHIVAKRNP